VILRLLISLFFSGCVMGVKVDPVTQPLDEIRASIVNISGEVRTVGETRRQFETKFFSRKPSKSFDPTTSKERLYARFTVLGTRRPYSVLVQVFVQIKDGPEYVDDGEDDDMAEQIAKDLELDLSKSREQRNAVDSFRAF